MNWNVYWLWLFVFYFCKCYISVRLRKKKLFHREHFFYSQKLMEGYHNCRKHNFLKNDFILFSTYTVYTCTYIIFGPPNSQLSSILYQTWLTLNYSEIPRTTIEIIYSVANNCYYWQWAVMWCWVFKKLLYVFQMFGLDKNSLGKNRIIFLLMYSWMKHTHTHTPHIYYNGIWAFCTY